jgi:tRNA(fMet)-specific endonuclease VapC
MARTRYMLDTNICSFIIRQRPPSVLNRLQEVATAGDHICISAITYAELLFGANNKRASPKMPGIVADFVSRLDSISDWGRAAAEQAALIKRQLEEVGNPIGPNDILIAGHAIAVDAVLITDNVKEFAHVSGLRHENWINR